MDYMNEERVDTACVCKRVVSVCVCVGGGGLGAVVCVLVEQQVDTCFKESGVSVDSQWNVSELCLCVHLNRHS